MPKTGSPAKRASEYAEQADKGNSDRDRRADVERWALVIAEARGHSPTHELHPPKLQPTETFRILHGSSSQAYGGRLRRADTQLMTVTSLRTSVAGWRADAPWPEWTGRRRVMVGLLLGTPVLVGGLAWTIGFWVSWCTLFGGECSPEENRQLAVTNAVFFGSLLAFVVANAIVFVLRRELMWLGFALLPALILVNYVIR